MDDPVSRKTYYQKQLEEALKARDVFLKEHPHLQPFQDEIDRILERTAGFEKRMAVLALLIETKLYELKDAFANLHFVARKVQGIVDKTEAEEEDKRLDCSTDPGGYLN
jgi:uncharacterized protein YllA (UPF0747 family)